MFLYPGIYVILLSKYGFFLLIIYHFPSTHRKYFLSNSLQIIKMITIGSTKFRKNQNNSII